MYDSSIPIDKKNFDLKKNQNRWRNIKYYLNTFEELVTGLNCIVFGLAGSKEIITEKLISKKRKETKQ